MRARFVNESLDRFSLLDNDFLAENVLNEKLDINAISNKAKKLGVLASMFLMFAVGKSPEIQSKLPDKGTIEKSPLMINLAQEDHLSKDEVFKGFTDMLNLYKKEEPKRIMSAGDKGFIDSVNEIQPGRLDSALIARYDQYDEDILRAVDSLKAKGEEVDANLIKAIMLIETGMKPSKNSLGFEGFPQTKEYILNGWKDDKGKFHPGINQKYGTSFTMKDMYDANKSAEFIHYYIKGLQKSKWVENIEDTIIAYNWGMGNLAKWKRGEKDLPSQSVNYVKMLKAMKDYFVS